LAFDILLIDGKNLLYRVAYTHQDLSYKDETGTHPSGAIFGFLNALCGITQRWGSPAIICWESSADVLGGYSDRIRPGVNFRKVLYPDYKGDREDRGPEWDGWLRSIHEQQTKLVELLFFLGVDQAYGNGYEADDTLATMARALEGPEKVAIYTSDGDLWQCIDQNISVICPKKAQKKRITEKLIDVEAFVDEHGIQPQQWVHAKALSGDKGDNVPGVKGIGPKTALKLIQAHGTAAGAIEAAKAGKANTTDRLSEAIVKGQDVIELALDLVTVRHVDPLVVFEGEFDQAALDKLFWEYKFKTFTVAPKRGELMAIGANCR